MSDPYRVLGVSPVASQDDIRRAYWDQVRAHPPEREPEKFKIVRAAYEQIMRDGTQNPLFQLQAPDQWTPSRHGADIDSSFHPEDVLIALQGWGDLGREDFDDDFCEVNL